MEVANRSSRPITLPNWKWHWLRVMVSWRWLMPTTSPCPKSTSRSSPRRRARPLPRLCSSRMDIQISEASSSTPRHLGLRSKLSSALPSSLPAILSDQLSRKSILQRLMMWLVAQTQTLKNSRWTTPRWKDSSWSPRRQHQWSTAKSERTFRWKHWKTLINFEDYVKI